MQKLSSYAFLASNLLFFFVGSIKNLTMNSAPDKKKIHPKNGLRKRGELDMDLDIDH